MNCIKNERIKNEIIKNECIKNERIKNELIKKRTDPKLHSQLQPPPHTPQAPPEKVDIPSMLRPATQAEKVQEVGVQEASHMYMRVGAVTVPLDATYHDPYRVMVRERKKLLLEVGATRQWVSIDRLKPHTAAAAPAVAQPPPRGRPRKS